MWQKNLFNKVVYKGVLGALVGIVAGFMLAFVIWGLETAAIMISRSLSPNSGSTFSLPLEVLTFASMAIGAVIGSINGASVAITEEKKNK